MRTKALAISGILVAAMAATVATGQLTLPWAVSPLSVDQNKNVTMDFTNAPAQQVLDWLKKSGVNFVVETTSIPKDKRLTVHMKGQPMDKAVEAVAEALGLGMTKKGDIYTLRNGGLYWTSNLGALEELKGLKGNEGMVWSDKASKELFDKLGDAKDLEWTDQQKKEWLKKFGDGQEHKWSDEDRAKFEKEMQLFGEKMGKWGEEFGKSMEKMPKDGWHFKELPDGAWQMKEMPEIDAKVKEMLEKHLKDLPDMKFEFKEMPDLKKELDSMKLHEKIKESLKDMPDLKNFKFEKGEFADIGKLVDSLTPDQLAKAKSRGYLTPGDLTPEQKKLFGNMGDGEFTVTFEKGGKSVTFKSK